MKRLKPFLLNLILLWLVILLYRTNSYYTNFLRPDTQAVLLSIAITYTIIGSIYYYLYPAQQTKGTLVLRLIKKLITKIYKYITNPSVITPKITKQEKVTTLFIIVKIFFLPIMLNFFLNNFQVVKSQFTNLPTLTSLLSINSFNLLLFPLIMSLIFMLDTLYFSFGYSTDAKFLGNKIRSVEPTILGWLVALACYPPFNSLVTGYTFWYSDIYILPTSILTTFALRITTLIFFLIYLSATFALGTKCSNLTNRGIITRGPYSIIRHPAYISKVLIWWLVIIPIMSWTAFLSMLVWSVIYHLRTVTEERHLSQDREYIEYKQKVKYRYIPYIY